MGAGSVLASTIVGTKRADTLRGTAKADNLFGQAGNDTLIGLDGKDLLVGGVGSDRLFGGRGADRLFGGKGADRLTCGPGRDTAAADRRDRVAKDCENVTGLPKPPPPPPPPPPPVATAGTYCGTTNQGQIMCFDVVAAAGGQTVSNVRITVETTCQPSRQLTFILKPPTQASIRTDRTFSATVNRSRYTATLEGALDAAGTNASGTFTAHATAKRRGVQYECDSGSVSWKAKTPPPKVNAQYGTFCGFTDQGRGICFDVAGDPKTVTKLRLKVITQCMPSLTFRRSSRISTAYAIAEDGTFSFTSRSTGTASSGGAFTITHRMEGAFDAAGTSATGELAAHVAYDAPGGQHYECDSTDLGWRAKLQS